jgi:hypothetical protein
MRMRSKELSNPNTSTNTPNTTRVLTRGKAKQRGYSYITRRLNGERRERRGTMIY